MESSVRRDEAGASHELGVRVGVEWIVDAIGCRADRLRDLPSMRALLDRVVADLALTVIDARWHAFPGEGGVTGLYLLSESHLACHTYPEHGVATFNLHCCRARTEWPWRAVLSDTLGARRVIVESRARGGA